MTGARAVVCALCGQTVTDRPDRCCDACIAAKAGPPASDRRALRDVARLIHTFSGRGSSAPAGTSGSVASAATGPARVPKPSRRRRAS